ncbi:hypothetical protein PUN28_018412 [Cardiocondyla obscurior]|uniref:Uncharacterized protein n=1 Tax=Cardiocondyla obscurior TaxID=286306 RepID=A0AAW2EI64_9HYME
MLSDVHKPALKRRLKAQEKKKHATVYFRKYRQRRAEEAAVLANIETVQINELPSTSNDYSRSIPVALLDQLKNKENEEKLQISKTRKRTRILSSSDEEVNYETTKTQTVKNIEINKIKKKEKPIITSIKILSKKINLRSAARFDDKMDKILINKVLRLRLRVSFFRHILENLVKGKVYRSPL